MPYSEDDMLMLSGIQHYAFCPRQWALIHIEQQWNENLLTTEGHIMHQHVDDPFYRQKMGNHIFLRSVNLASKELGLYGIADMIELHPTEDAMNSISHPAYPGLWKPFPVEYKHGKPKRDDIDVMQLTAQAMCLEEQYNISIPCGAIYYGETRRRMDVDFNEERRSMVKELCNAMHKLYSQGVTPHASRHPYCRSCSLLDICMPDTANHISASIYLKQNLYEEAT